MVLGVRNAAIGLVRYTVETFALAYEAYPQIIATGGDALSLFADDEIVEHVVPDLQMVGIAEAFRLIGAESAN
jgi:pantothenate kinase type III